MRPDRTATTTTRKVWNRRVNTLSGLPKHPARPTKPVVRHLNGLRRERLAHQFFGLSAGGGVSPSFAGGVVASLAIGIGIVNAWIFFASWFGAVVINE